MAEQHITEDVGSIAKRTLKDSLFINLFKEKQNVLALYKNLHPDDTTATDDDISIITLENAIIKGPLNDVGFIVGNRVMCLVEAQSYRLDSILLRSLIYISKSVERYMAERNITFYNVKPSNIPKWELYILMAKNLNKNKEPQLWKFTEIPSDLFDLSKGIRCIIPEVGIISDYTRACNIVDDNINTYGNGIRAVDNIFTECEKIGGLLGNYMNARRVEIVSLYDDMFDKEANMKMNIHGAKIEERIEIAKRLIRDHLITLEDVPKYFDLSDVYLEQIKLELTEEGFYSNDQSSS